MKGTHSKDTKTTDPVFSERLTLDAFRQYIEDPKVKFSPNAIKLLSELMRTITKEAANRSSFQAMRNGDDLVDVSHFEKILAQLLLDL